MTEKDNSSKEPESTPQELNSQLRLLYSQFPINPSLSEEMLSEFNPMHIRVDIKEGYGEELDKEELEHFMRVMIGDSITADAVMDRRLKSQHREAVLEKLKVLLEQSYITPSFRLFIEVEWSEEYLMGVDSDDFSKRNLAWLFNTTGSADGGIFAPERAMTLELIGLKEMRDTVRSLEEDPFPLRKTLSLTGWDSYIDTSPHHDSSGVLTIQVGVGRVQEAREKYNQWQQEFTERYNEEPSIDT